MPAGIAWAANSPSPAPGSDDKPARATASIFVDCSAVRVAMVVESIFAAPPPTRLLLTPASIVGVSPATVFEYEKTLIDEALAMLGAGAAAPSVKVVTFLSAASTAFRRVFTVLCSTAAPRKTAARRSFDSAPAHAMSNASTVSFPFSAFSE